MMIDTLPQRWGSLGFAKRTRVRKVLCVGATGHADLSSWRVNSPYPWDGALVLKLLINSLARAIELSLARGPSHSRDRRLVTWDIEN